MASSDSKSPSFLARAVDFAVDTAFDAATAAVARLDSVWVNQTTGQGTERDKLTATQLEWNPITAEQCETLYRAGAIHGRVVDLPVDECARPGFEVRIPGDPELAQAMNTWHSDLQTAYHLQEADRLSMQYGGGLVMIGTTSRGREASVPSLRLNLDDVENVDFLNHFSSREAVADNHYGELGRAGYGMPQSYRLSPLLGGYVRGGWDTLHASRALALHGVPMERHITYMNQGWGDSLYQRIHTGIMHWGSSYAGVAHLLTDVNQGVFNLPELTQMLVMGKEELVMRRFSLVDRMRSLSRSIVLGQGETFQRVPTQMAGIPDALHALDFMLCAIIGLPVTAFMGQAPAGLNATGSADLQIMNKTMDARRVKKLVRPLEYLTKVMFRAKKGPAKGKEPKGWSIVFGSLEVMSSTERADYREKVMRTDTGYVQAGVLSSGEVAQSRFGGDKYSDETSLDDRLLTPAQGAPESPDQDEQSVPPENKE